VNFLDIQGYDVKEGRNHEFQQWLSANEEKIALECPEGISYKGTYVLVRSSERKLGSTITIFEMENYACLDRFANAMKEGGTFARLIDEMTDFVDQRNDAQFGDMLGRRVVDAAIWGQ